MAECEKIIDEVIEKIKTMSVSRTLADILDGFHHLFPLGDELNTFRKLRNIIDYKYIYADRDLKTLLKRFSEVCK